MTTYWSLEKPHLRSTIPRLSDPSCKITFDLYIGIEIHENFSIRWQQKLNTQNLFSNSLAKQQTYNLPKIIYEQC